MVKSWDLSPGFNRKSLEIIVGGTLCVLLIRARGPVPTAERRG